MSDFLSPSKVMDLMKEDPKILAFTMLALTVVLFTLYTTFSGTTAAPVKKKKVKNKKEYERLKKKKEQKKQLKKAAAISSSKPTPPPSAPAVVASSEATGATGAKKNKKNKKNKNKNKKKKQKALNNNSGNEDDEDVDLGGAKRERQLQQQQAKKAAAAEKMYRTLQAAANNNTATDDGWETQTNKKSNRQSRKTAKAATAGVGGRVVPGSAAAVQQQLAQQPRQAPAPAAPPTDQVELSVLVEGRVLGGIIGSGGSTLKKIQELTGATIDIPRRTQGSDGAPTRTRSRVAISLTGTREAASSAKKIIQDLAKKGYSMTLSQADGEQCKEHTSRIPTGSVAEIVGTGGKIITRIKEALHVRINIADNKERAPMTRVMIFGPSDGVDKTRDVIKNICEKHYDPLTHPGFSHLSVQLNSGSEMGLVIGVRGSNRKHIESMSKCRIFIPDRGSPNELTIQIVGPSQGLKLANKMVQGILTKHEEEQKEWDEKRAKEAEAEANGEDPDLLEVAPELQKYLKPSSNMTVSLGIN